MRMIALCFVLLTAFFAQGCSYRLYVKGYPRPGQNARFESGVPVLESSKINVVAMRPVSSSVKGKLMFYVVVANLTNVPFDLSLESISVFSQGHSLKLWSRDDILRKFQRAAKWQAFVVALGAASDKYNASKPSITYASGQYRSRGSNGYSYGTFSGAFETYDPAASAAAKVAISNRASSQLQAIAIASAAQQTSVQDILTCDTIDPGGYFGGLLLMDLPSGFGSKLKTISFIVRTPDDKHVFDFAVRKN